MQALAPGTSLRCCSLSFAGEEDRRAVYAIRHEVYARELHQHAANDRGELTDALDRHNLYIVARRHGGVVGFVSITPPPGPYSLDKYLPRDRWPVAAGVGTYEVRLLTVTAAARGTSAAMGLMYAALRYVQHHGGTSVIGIGREEVLPMYVRAGMRPSGQVVTSGAVRFHVMSAAVTALMKANAASISRMLDRMKWELEFAVREEEYVDARANVGCFHGGASINEAGRRFERLHEARQTINADVLDAWFDPAPSVIEALRDHLPWLVRTSPPADCGPLVAAIAEERGVSPDAVVPGAGSSDLIIRCLRHWLTRESKVLLLDPTYGEYAHVLERVIGCRPERFCLDAEADYAMDLAALALRLREPFDLVILVNPNSPTGTFTRPEVLGPILADAASRGTRVWVDETYVDYVGADESMERLAVGTRGLFVCKSMSKAYALSGMRVAYLCGHSQGVGEIRSITPPWVVGTAAQVAAVSALADPAYYSRQYEQTRVYRRELVQDLRQLGIRVLEGPANFVLIDSTIGSQELVRHCVERRVYLRDAGSMGITDGRTVRIAVKSREGNARIALAIRSALRPAAEPAPPGHR